MTAKSLSADPRSMDAQTAELIRKAHECNTSGAIESAVPYRNLGELWASLGERHADKPWMIYYPCESADEPTTTLTYGQFSQRIDRVARLLAEAYDIGNGGTIATLTINQPLTVATYFAAWRLGARVVPINPGETDDRIGYILENSGATLLVAHRSARQDFTGIERMLPGGLKRAMVSDEADPAAIPPGWDDYVARVDAADPEPSLPPVADVSPDAEALVVYTSGTTGPPKGVVLTQKQMFADAYGISQWHRIDADTVMMNVLPIHHVNGIVVTLVTPAFVGGSVVVNKRFRSRGFWEKLAKHGVHIVSVVPTLLQFLIDADEPLDAAKMPRFRHFICGAGPLSVELAREFQDRFKLRILHGYGLSESVCYSCFLPVDLPWETHLRWMYDHGFPSIGCPIVTNEMAIHDPDGRPVPDGEKGEIVIRGHNIMAGYFRNPQANASTFKHGWFRSGDEGFKLRGEDGRDYYFITGRLKELIIRGGVNISPFEIDEVLSAIPGVRVGLAVGFENRYYGEEVGAYVQLEPGKTLTEAEVIAQCRAHLPFSKCPKVVHFGDDIPVTSTGKYQRGRLKHLFEPYQDRQFRG